MQIRMTRDDRLRHSDQRFKSGQVLEAPRDITLNQAQTLVNGGSAQQIGTGTMEDRMERNVPKRESWVVLKHRIR